MLACIGNNRLINTFGSRCVLLQDTVILLVLSGDSGKQPV